MRESLGLEGENIDILSKSTEEALNTKIEVLKEFMCSGPELAKALPRVKSGVAEAHRHQIVRYTHESEHKL